MKNTFGNNITVTIFGESHGTAVGAVLDGLKAGLDISEEYIAKRLSLRAPKGDISTSRKEADKFQILSGVLNGKTTGTPITVVIPNENTKSKDYNYGIARPSHADYTAYAKYGGFEDYRGGGHFSARVTAGLVAVGAIVQYLLEQRGIRIATHIDSSAGIKDSPLTDFDSAYTVLSDKYFAVLDDVQGEKMQKAITDAKADGDSVGGVLETVVSGMPAGVGEPWFDSVESMLSHAMFSIPAIKAVEFGDGFEICKKRGSEANDAFYIDNGVIKTRTNSNGGINGGITNGMPIVMRVGIKPTPTIFKKQQTVDFINMKECELEQKGRHDPCVVHRARAVVESAVAITLFDLLDMAGL